MADDLRISINQQLEEVEHELKMRREVYPRRVSKGAMSKRDMDYRTARMEAVKKTLLWVQENETAFRAWVVEKARGGGTYGAAPDI